MDTIINQDPNIIIYIIPVIIEEYKNICNDVMI